MSARHLDDEQLEDLALGEPRPDELKLRAHLAGCSQCASGLFALRGQREALSAWVDARDASPAEVGRLWPRIAARLAREAAPVRLVAEASAQDAPRRSWARPIAAALAAAAAGALLAGALRTLPRAGPPDSAASAPARPELVQAAADEPDGKPTPSALAALARAEQQYRRAADVLEQQVARHTGAAKGAARTSAALARSRRALSPGSAASPARARVRVLEGYAAYLKSLRRALDESRD